VVIHRKELLITVLQSITAEATKCRSLAIGHEVPCVARHHPRRTYQPTSTRCVSHLSVSVPLPPGTV